ncbi:hypothetical protein ACKLNR_010464 [Fusarium oxysporum f. sp. zingiberi]
MRRRPPWYLCGIWEPDALCVGCRRITHLARSSPDQTAGARIAVCGYSSPARARLPRTFDVIFWLCGLEMDGA